MIINVFIAVCAAAAVVGAVCTACQIYGIVKLDAEARGLKHPKLWGLFAMGGNNSSGLLLYLIGRRNYPVVDMTEERQRKINSGKKRALAGLIFLAAGAIGMIVLLTAA